MAATPASHHSSPVRTGSAGKSPGRSDSKPPSREDRLPRIPATSLHTEILFESLDTGDAKQIRDLVTYDHADLNGHDWMHNGGRTPMHRAVENRNVDLMRLLVDLGGSVNVPDGKGRSPMHLACRIGDVDILKVLLTAEEVDFDMGSHVRASVPVPVYVVVCLAPRSLAVCVARVRDTRRCTSLQFTVKRSVRKCLSTQERT
jgi:hypothetical protein